MITIRNGRLIDPRSGVDGEFDIAVENGRIAAVEPRGKGPTGSETIDAAGRWIVPGLVDLHVHLREPGFEWKETVATGVRAAVSGGYTSICCMANTSPVNDNAEITRFIRERAQAAGLARVYPIGAVTKGLKGAEMAPLSELREAGCIAFSDDGEPVANAGLMRRALEWAGMLDAPICCHEEDKSITCGGAMNESALSTRLGLKGWPKVGEEVLIARDIELARATNGRVHICHVTTARGVELVRRAKHDGIRVTAEVTPHHLTLTEDRVREYDTYAKMSPPLREEEDLEALLAGLKDGTIDALASDHAPHEEDSKRVEFGKASFGIIGLQTSLSLMMRFILDGKLPHARAFEAMASSPALIAGLLAGSLAKGMPADIVIVDPAAEWRLERSTVLSLSKNSPYLGAPMRGRAETVLVGGKTVLRAGELV